MGGSCLCGGGGVLEPLELGEQVEALAVGEAVNRERADLFRKRVGGGGQASRTPAPVTGGRSLQGKVIQRSVWRHTWSGRTTERGFA
jgi:hypothetical protein